MAYFLGCCGLIDLCPPFITISIGDISDEPGPCCFDVAKNSIDNLCLLPSCRPQILVSVLVCKEMEIKITLVVDDVESSSTDNVYWTRLKR